MPLNAGTWRLDATLGMDLSVGAVAGWYALKMTNVGAKETGRPFVFRQCMRKGCGLRFPAFVDDRRGERCPRCDGPLQKAGGGALHQEEPIAWRTEAPCLFSVLLDNVRSAFNVGSIFRTASGAGLAGVHLCGITPTPENPKIGKTALGAELSVSWTYRANALEAAAELSDNGVSVWALENVSTARSLFDQTLPRSGTGVCLVVGNELTGIDPALLALCDDALYIPMAGVKGSLNVAVAFGIAAYWLRGAAAASTMGCCQ